MADNADASDGTSPPAPETESRLLPEALPSEEPAPMIDVHPPHHAVNTWRDFLIHMITIVLGLLIAIGLEQSVEALHHLHQRHDLEHDLHLEAKKNLGMFQRDYLFCDMNNARLVALHRYVEAVRANPHQSAISYDQLPPEPLRVTFWFPVESSWNTAKESSFVALLPRDEATMFYEVYVQNDLLLALADKYFDIAASRRRFEMRFADPSAPDASAVGRMGPDDLKQYSGLISDAIDALSQARFALDLANGASIAAENGARSGDDLQRTVSDQMKFVDGPASERQSSK
jgi:hypothetical protein